MKIAIATNEGEVSLHFGFCSAYTIAEIENNEVKKTEILPHPGHEPELLAPFLATKGVKYFIVGEIESKAKSVFTYYGIEVITNKQGRIEDALDDFFQKLLEASIQFCTSVTIKVKDNKVYYACR